MVRNYVKKPQIQYDDKEIQLCLATQLLINNGVSSGIRPGMASIVEIYPDQHFIFQKLKRFLF